MSNSQNKIMSKVLAKAQESKQNTKIAAAICSGNKILAIDVNTHRSKYGEEIRCAGHGEIAAIHKLLPYSFKGRRKKSRVLQVQNET